MQMRSHLGRVRGLGSSNDGIHHWWMQRLSGVALVPLCLWFVFSVVGLLVNADLPTVTDWVGRHYNPVLLILLIFCMFHHAQLGLQVIQDLVCLFVTILAITFCGKGNWERPRKLGREMPNRKCSESQHALIAITFMQT